MPAMQNEPEVKVPLERNNFKRNVSLDSGWFATCSDFEGGGDAGAPPCRILTRSRTWPRQALVQ